MPFQGWNGPRPEALVGDAVLVAHAQREGRVVIEEKSGGVIVEAEEQHVGLALGEPLRHRLVALEQRLPVRVVLLALVESDADGRDMRGADAADDFRHVKSRRAGQDCPPGFYAAAPAPAPSARTGPPGRRRSACACRHWDAANRCPTGSCRGWVRSTRGRTAPRRRTAALSTTRARHR